MGDTFGPEESDPEEAATATPDDEDPNPPYEPPIGHTWATWLN